MNTQFEILRKSRALVLKKIDNLSIEQLHKIPEGFKNNIAWNVAHLVVTQQLLHYKLSELNCLVSDELIENYRKGTSPTETFSEEDFEEVKELFIGLPDTLQEDFEAGIFNEYISYETSLGFTIDSIETAIAFNNLHEGIHLGIIMALAKIV
ncbi:DinB family protein [Tenacibaculum aestuariivivum]|uniref:DinB family protein n=1 Tax=Tenacibaculum aestuariivivum TaxID=2006131 RepID=UPI003AB23BB0